MVDYQVFLKDIMDTVISPLYLRVNSIRYHTFPSDLFYCEMEILQNYPSDNPDMAISIAKNEAKKRIHDYELSKRRKDVKNMNLFGMEFTPDHVWIFFGSEITSKNEWIRIQYFIDKFNLIDEKTQKEISTYNNLIHTNNILAANDFYKSQELTQNLLWIDGTNVAIEYLKGLEFRLEKEREREEHEVRLSDLLDFNKAELIGKSFKNPTFIQWFYKRELPAYSWSSRDGEPMMKALTIGEYKKSYEAEINLIEKTVRDIGGRYG